MKSTKSLKHVVVSLLLLAACRQAGPEVRGTQAVEEALQVVPLKYAAAPELADTLNDLMAASRRAAEQRAAAEHVRGTSAAPAPSAYQSAAKPEVAVTADARTNSLVIRAAPAEMAKLLEIVAKLDVQVH